MGVPELPHITTHRVSSRLSISSISSASSDRSFAIEEKELLSDPLPSPGLPIPVIYHGRRRPTLFRTITGLIPWLLVGSVLFWALSAFFFRHEYEPNIRYLKGEGEQAQLTEQQETVPEGPGAVMLTDKSGKTRWTLSIPSTETFPLTPNVYAGLCRQSDIIVQQIAQFKNPKKHSHAGHFGYYHKDKKFMDVPEAEKQGLLPHNKESDWLGRDDSKPICKKSLTYVMETDDAGFGPTLMGLWMSYGLAKKEGRAFFVDDRNWAYGKYIIFFKPPPEQSCSPPPEHQRLPCPHQAQHLLVSAATTPWTFGNAFTEQYEDPKAMEVKRQKNIFHLLHIGYQNLFDLTEADQTYVNKRIDTLDSQIYDKGGLQIGVHVRHGDKHPWEFQYQKSYIPLENYVEAVRKEMFDTFTSPNGTEDHPSIHASKMILASDDPDVYTSPTFSFALRAQEQIELASKSHIDAANGGTKQVDDSVGFEGGFFKDVFWGLGETDAAIAHSAKAITLRALEIEKAGRIVPSESALQLRGLVGRAYLLDLAVLGRADRVVCTVSSVGCRLLAVMMGWERGIVKKGWINVDGEFDWVGIRW